MLYSLHDISTHLHFLYSIHMLYISWHCMQLTELVLVVVTFIKKIKKNMLCVAADCFAKTKKHRFMTKVKQWLFVRSQFHDNGGKYIIFLFHAIFSSARKIDCVSSARRLTLFSAELPNAKKMINFIFNSALAGNTIVQHKEGKVTNKVPCMSHSCFVSGWFERRDILFFASSHL
jgi:hypothetical protein